MMKKRIDELQEMTNNLAQFQKKDGGKQYSEGEKNQGDDTSVH